MPNNLAQKLKIKEAYTLLTINAPEDFKKELGELPADVTITDKTGTYHQIHWFVRDKTQMEEDMEKVANLLKEDVTIWIYFPKGSSKIQTDLTRDKGWESLHKRANLQMLNLISFNETWSSFSMRLKTDKDEKKTAAPKARAIFQYIDPVKKQVILPDDFSNALSGVEKDFFEGLSFSNKKEYIEWIVSAKREETRSTRVKESIERLAKKWKNPANR